LAQAEPLPRLCPRPRNVVEGWHDVNDVILFGKSGEFASNQRDQQELTVLSLHLLQAALVYVNTLMIQDILAEPAYARGLRPSAGG